jgi:hypothetical protein
LNYKWNKNKVSRHNRSIFPSYRYQGEYRRQMWINSSHR